jgi:two-component sensor histidine kinase
VDANIQIPINDAIPLGLILNEAVTNSFKYAFKDKDKGIISVQILELSNEIKCAISDDGVGIPKDFNIEELNSYGMELIQTLVMQLEGSMEIKNQNGTQINITIPQS